jgi:hypothetical protein
MPPRGVQPTGWDSSKSYGWGYRDLETVVKDAVDSILGYEELWKRHVLVEHG